MPNPLRYIARTGAKRKSSLEFFWKLLPRLRGDGNFCTLSSAAMRPSEIWRGGGLQTAYAWMKLNVQASSAGASSSAALLVLSPAVTGTRRISTDARSRLSRGRLCHIRRADGGRFGWRTYRAIRIPVVE